MHRIKGLEDFFSSDERQNSKLVEIGILNYEPQTDKWIVSGSRWGININPYSKQPHNPMELAIHESGHVLMSLLMNLKFDYVEISPNRNVGGQVVCSSTGLENNPTATEIIQWAEKKVKIYSSGPIATSLIQHRNFYSWEQCASDVVPIGFLEYDFLSELGVSLFIHEAQQTIQGNWKHITALASKLIQRKKMSYEECKMIISDES